MTEAKRSKRTLALTRVGIFPTEEVLPLIEEVTSKTKIEFHGHIVSVGSVRMRMFLHQGLECVVCGKTGEYFAMEKHTNDKDYHFNLYAVDRSEDSIGSEKLMTKDHIIPRSKGGGNGISNMQPMCADCNSEKGNEFDGTEFKHDAPINNMKNLLVKAGVVKKSSEDYII